MCRHSARSRSVDTVHTTGRRADEPDETSQRSPAVVAVLGALALAAAACGGHEQRQGRRRRMPSSRAVLTLATLTDRHSTRSSCRVGRRARRSLQRQRHRSTSKRGWRHGEPDYEMPAPSTTSRPARSTWPGSARARSTRVDVDELPGAPRPAARRQLRPRRPAVFEAGIPEQMLGRSRRHRSRRHRRAARPDAQAARHLEAVRSPRGLRGGGSRTSGLGRREEGTAHARRVAPAGALFS